jgi:cobyrinic acid a,c-diamide synthase
LPIIMVVDCARQSHSVAALVHGFSTFRPDISIAALVLNRVGSNRHESMLREALAEIGIPVIACIPRADELKLPERHLGLVQAGEHKSLENFINSAADVLEPRLHVVLLKGLLESSPKQKMAEPQNAVPLQPFGQRIAVAKDGAFSFIYPHVVQGWRDAGAELSFFSPLADEAPDPACDAVFLPGGYPELHAANLANARTFRRGMMEAAKRARIYGECGGFMVLGDRLIDAEGSSHEMLGLLPVATSFAARKLHLGYRIVDVSANSPVWPGAHFAAHEFHYTTQISEQAVEPFAAKVSDARGSALGPAGAVNGGVAGSYLHLICERQHD